MMSFLFSKTPLLFFVQSFWRDEAFSYLLAKKSLWEIITLTARDFNPPFYYILLHFWLKILSSSEIVLRSLSLVFYWATIYIVFLFLRQIFKFNLKKSFVYLLLVAINPLLVYYAFETRMYTLFAFLATWSLYLFFKKKYKACLVITTLGLYTHYFMIFVVIGQFVFSWLMKKDRQPAIKYLLLSIIIFLPWVIYVLFVQSIFKQPFWIEPTKFIYLFNLLGTLYTGNEISQNAPRSTLLIMTSIILNLIFIFIFTASIFNKKGFNKNDKQLIFFLFIFSLVIPFFISLISLIKPIYYPRYLIFATVELQLLIIFLIDRWQFKFRPLIILALYLLSVFYQINQVYARQKTDIRKIIKEIKFLAKKTTGYIRLIRLIS